MNCMDLTYHCKSCGRLLCGKCMEGHESQILVASDAIKSLDEVLEFCKFCRSEGDRMFSGKVYPSLSPRESPEPPSLSSISIRTDETINCEKIQAECFPRFIESHATDHSPHSATCSSVTSFSGHPSPVGFQCSSSRSDEEETEDSGDHLFSPSSEYGHDDVSDTDMSSISGRHEFYNFKLLGSSSSYCPSRNRFTSNIASHTVQQEQIEGTMTLNDGPYDHETMAVLKRPDVTIKDPGNTNNFIHKSILHDQYQEKPLDFENNGLFWYPPPPEENEIEDNFFAYDDDEDDIGDSGTIFSSLRTLPSLFRAKEKQSEENKEPLRAVVQTHFRALVSQLLEGVNIKTDKDTSGEEWLDIVTTLAWKAANYVKPDTSRGGSMDPVDYVKVKCIATGIPNESTFIKGVICTKNITHKRMTSQYKNARLLILGGALEYQRVPNQLSSFDTLLQQEIEHLKMIIRKIEAHRPNVLLVEKSVSSYAQGFLLEKGISLVLNVKRTLLERIARCTGAFITSSIDSISTARLGHCELFRLERVSEDLETSNQFNRKPSKTLMYFEGCPRRLGCTVLLKGTCRQELKKLKHVVQYAIFAGYHLSLETSFLADEGASLPKMTLNPSYAIPDIVAVNSIISDRNRSEASSIDASSILHTSVDFPAQEEQPACISPLSPGFVDYYGNVNRPCDANEEHLISNLGLDVDFLKVNSELNECTILPSDITNDTVSELRSPGSQEEMLLPFQLLKLKKLEKIDENDPSNDYFSATDSHQSILLSYSNRCVSKGTLCERSRLLRIQFYGCFDKPLGRYLHDDLFDQKTYCQSCNEPGEAHVQCFTHRQGSLTISVKRIPNLKLQGERDRKIWMWHRCLRCKHVNGIPPATHRVAMSDAAFGLSFGKFLELSFSNHATANRVATCGHSLQRDCLRYYGYGSMVAFFRYTPIDIFSVHLPPTIIEFNSHFQRDWIKKEAAEIFRKMETLYAEITGVLYKIEHGVLSSGHKLETTELHNHIIELYDLVETERNDCDSFLQSAVDILELNDLRRSLIISSHVWDRRLQSLSSLLKIGGSTKETQASASFVELKDCKNELSIKDGKLNVRHEKDISECSKLEGSPKSKLCPEQRTEFSLHLLECDLPDKEEEHDPDGGINTPSPGSSLSDKIDSAWTVGMVKKVNRTDNPPLESMKSPMRVYSFDSALRVQDKIEKGFPHSSLHLSRLRSFHASSEHRYMIRTYSHVSPCEAQNVSSVFTSTPSLLSSASKIAEGARLLLRQTGHGNIVIAVYDNEPTSIISYALCSKEYDDLIADKPCEKEGSAVSYVSSWQSFGSLDLDNVQCGSYGNEEASSSISSLFTASKKSSHLKISFADESITGGGKVKFSVTCYFAKQFQTLRKKSCPSEVDFVRSLSRCKRWSAQGGKSNVFFAKSLDERFIIKQVTKTELESFGDFSPEYFKYLSDSLTSKSPTCLAKILGIYQISVKHLKGGRETKMVLMVMENLFFNRSVSRVYDLKGSVRSRYNPHTKGTNSVLLDMNLLETLHTKPIFLGSKAKRSLERAVWNDTSFLAAVDVMDYSLLVGVDEERRELVLGIIDIMRQYTWDKHLETWVKASGLLGGPKNASPTIISPKQYKRRFRKAMTTYFLTVPDQWSS